MKRVIIAVLVLLSVQGYSQYTPQFARGYQFKYVKVDSGFVFPVRDTTTVSGITKLGSVVVRPGDSSIYIYTNKWEKLAIDSAGLSSLFANKVDSVKIATDTLYYYINGVGYGSVFTVSSLYPTGHTFNTSTGVLSTARNGTTPITVDLDGRFSLLTHSHAGLNPIGGNTGQILKKNSNSDYDYSWQNEGGGFVTTTQLDDSTAAIRADLAGGGIDTLPLSNRISLKKDITDSVLSTGYATNYDLKKSKDSVQTNIDLKVNISDTASMLNPYFREVGFSLSKSGHTVSFDSTTGFHTQPYNDIRYLQTSTSVAGNTVLTGGQVTWISGLTYYVSPTTYVINGVQYSFAGGNVTLAAADPSDDRQDAIVLTTSQTATSITGTPDTNPLVPTEDPLTQIFLTSGYIAAAATTPSNITQVIIRDEGAGGEWSITKTLTSTDNYGVNPYNGSISQRITAASNNQYLQWTKPSGTVSKSSYTNLIFFIRNNATFSSNRNWLVQLFNGTTQVGTNLNLTAYGYSKTIIGSYGTIAVKLSDFGGADLFDNIRLVNTGTGGTVDVQVDYIQLQGGVTNGGGGSGGTVKNITATNNYAQTWTITNSTTTPNLSLALDTTLLSTRLWRQKGIDSVQANVNLKLNISDTTGKWVSNIRRSNDSVYILKNSTWTFVYKDSTGLTSFYDSTLMATQQNLKDTAAAIRADMGGSETDPLSVHLTGTSTLTGNIIIDGTNASGYNTTIKNGDLTLDNGAGLTGARGNLILKNDRNVYWNNTSGPFLSANSTTGNYIFSTVSGGRGDFYGGIKFPNYGGGLRTGTAAYNLQIDASGNVIEGALSGGSGTVTSFSKTDNYGITSSVTNATTTPNHAIAVDTTVIASKSYVSNAITANVPDLQAVTDAGSTITNLIDVRGNTISVSQSDGSKPVQLRSSVAYGGSVRFTNGAGKNADLYPLNLTADREFQFPNYSGTLAAHPTISGQAGKVLAVNATEDGLEWITAGGGGGTTTNALTIGAELSPTGATSFDGSAAKTIGIQAGSVTNAMLANTAVANLSGTNTGDQTSVTGNAGTATTLQNTRTIWGQNFNGSANVTGDLTLGTGNITGTGSIATTGSRITKLWATDIESTNMPTVGGTSLSSTFQASDADLTTWAGITPAAGVGTFLATPSSANLRTALTDENGTGAALFNGATTPDFTTGITVGGAAASGNILQGDGTKYAPTTNTGGWSVLRVASSNFTTTSTSLADITGLVTGTLSTGTLYEFEANLYVNSTTTAGMAVGVQQSGTGTGQIGVWSGTATSATATGMAIASNALNQAGAPCVLVNGDGSITIKGFVKTGSSGSPTISIKALKTTSGTATVYIGSVLRYRVAQ